MQCSQEFHVRVLEGRYSAAYWIVTDRFCFAPAPQVSEVSMALLVPMDYRVPPAPLGPPPSPTAS